MAPNRRIPLRWGRKRRVWWFTRRVRRARLAEQHDQAEDDDGQPRSASASDGTRTPRWASRSGLRSLGRGAPTASWRSATTAAPWSRRRSECRQQRSSHDLIAAFVAILWRYHTTGRARLWLLPVLMIVWVNTHLGFFVGLGLIGIYVGFEVLEVISAPSPQQEGAPPSVGHCRKWLAR